ncbi:MAG TPA: YggT family protein [Longimicrobiaceae bacterium]|jgi:YggT family protein|nr:YggT family protein [Longimicrobiaceae bacterium]
MGWALLLATLNLFKLLILARVILSWVVSPMSRNPAVEAIRRITDTVLRPISSILPPMGGLDLSPLVAFFAISLLQNLIASQLVY